MTRRKKLVIAASVAAIGMIAFAILRGPAPIEIESATVRRDTVIVAVDEEGETRVRDRYVLASPIGGRLSRVSVREGDNVAEGQVIARLYPAPEDGRIVAATRARISAADARRAETAARVAEVEGQYEQAEREAERQRKLAEAGALSRESVEQAELAAASAGRQLEAARSSLRAAEADVAVARSQLVGADGESTAGRAIDVRAPVAGRVLRVHEKSERVVLAGAPIVDLADAGGLEVVIDVLSEDAVSIEPGAPIRITDWGGDEVITGSVRLVEPAAFTRVSALGVEEQRVNIIGDLHRPPLTLGTGYRVQASIITWQDADVLAVPTSALFRSGRTWQVFAIVEGRARMRDVQIGHRGRDAAEVTRGLEEGDRVILFPSDQIADGVRVRSRTPEAATMDGGGRAQMPS